MKPSNHMSLEYQPVLLFSESGTPLVHHYRVLSRGGAHASLCGRFMSIQSILVATQEYPASPQSLTSRSSTVCLDLDAISSGDSESGSSAIRASPVSMIR